MSARSRNRMKSLGRAALAALRPAARARAERPRTILVLHELLLGDTLMLEIKPEAMVTVRCGDITLTEGRMGRVGDRVAVRVAKPLRKPRTTFAMFEKADEAKTTTPMEVP